MTFTFMFLLKKKNFFWNISYAVFDFRKLLYIELYFFSKGLQDKIVFNTSREVF